MLRRGSFSFGLSVLIIIAVSRYTDHTNYNPSPKSRRNVRKFLKTEDGEENLLQKTVTMNPYDDGPSNINQLLEKTRTTIKLELINYNFSDSGVHKLEDLLIESNGQPLRSLIISTWRSGTTFLGEVLNAMQGNFYHYEPLLKYYIIQIRGPPYADQALSTIKNMFKCDFYGLDDYFKFGKGHLHQFARQLLQKYPDRLSVLCYEELALNPNETTHELLKFLKLSATPSVDEFLHSHTNLEVGGVSSTFRVSRNVPFRWKNVLDFNYVIDVQLACKEAINLWGYRMAYNGTHMASNDFYPLDPYVIKL